jgi:hypothetical protein
VLNQKDIFSLKAMKTRHLPQIGAVSHLYNFNPKSLGKSLFLLKASKPCQWYQKFQKVLK